MKHLQSWVVESTHHIFSVKDVHLYSGLSKTVLVNMQNKKYSCPGCSFEIQSPRWGRGCPQTRPDALRGTPQGQSHDRGPVQGHDQGRLGDSHLKPPDFFGDKICPLRTGLLLDNHLILSTAFLAEMKDRSSYQQSINVLKAISDGLGESEIKSGEGLSRYSYSTSSTGSSTQGSSSTRVTAWFCSGRDLMFSDLMERKMGPRSRKRSK